MRTGVQIIECIDKDDPGSEGQFLKHMFDLMRIKSSYIHVDSAETFIKAIEESKYKYIHITCHGRLIGDEEKFIGWWTQGGVVTVSKLKNSLKKITATAIISTACNSGNVKFAQNIIERLGCKFYIAPKKSPSFHNSAIFSHLFYYKLFRTKKNGEIPLAFEAYKNKYKNPHHFSMWQ